MNEKILFVDDDPNMLSSLKRQVHDRYPVTTASTPKSGLLALEKDGPFAVVVSDYQMPELNGVQFLSSASEIAPDTVRIMLTGQWQSKVSIDAINYSHIFRFLSKPCPSENLLKTLNIAIDHYLSSRDKRQAFEQTLNGAIKSLIDILAITNPGAHKRSLRVQALAKSMAEHLPIKRSWEIETAALLSQIGFITIPLEITKKVQTNLDLTAEEKKLLDQHPLEAKRLLTNFPSLFSIAEAITFQRKAFDGLGAPKDDLHGQAIPYMARVLKVILDFDALVASGLSPDQSLLNLIKQAKKYDPEILATFHSLCCSGDINFTNRLTYKGSLLDLNLAYH